MINVLSYWHHPDLWWSLELLCKRLGFNLYKMAGMDWYDKGYFRIYSDPTRSEPEYATKYLCDDLFYYSNIDPDFPKEKPLYYSEALETQIDIILCSNRETEIPLARFQKDHKPNAKMVRQVGNMLDIVDSTLYPNALYSDLESYLLNIGSHKLLYHQEIDMNLFTYEQPVNTKNIYTFQNDFHQYQPADEFSKQLREKFPDYNFKEHGRNTIDGFIFPKRDYIQEVKNSSFTWQIKHWDGYSHNIHSSFALGRPMILRRSDIKGKIFEPLCDETTTIFTDQLDRIRTVNLQEMSKDCRRKFIDTVNFDDEGEKLNKFFSEIL